MESQSKDSKGTRVTLVDDCYFNQTEHLLLISNKGKALFLRCLDFGETSACLLQECVNRAIIVMIVLMNILVNPSGKK